MNTNKITLKIMGKEPHVLNTLEQIESAFPLSVRSKIMPNDDGINCHVWLTIAVEAYPLAKSQPQQATNTPTKHMIEAANT